jgi:hypothetical protein
MARVVAKAVNERKAAFVARAVQLAIEAMRGGRQSGGTRGRSFSAITANQLCYRAEILAADDLGGELGEARAESLQPAHFREAAIRRVSYIEGALQEFEALKDAEEAFGRPARAEGPRGDRGGLRRVRAPLRGRVAGEAAATRRGPAECRGRQRPALSSRTVNARPAPKGERADEG